MESKTVDVYFAKFDKVVFHKKGTLKHSRSGGFIGVDIFFVISGYLITLLLVNDMQDNSFSILNFYERRARRLLPALFLVMLSCIPFAWLWMLPDALENFGQSLVANSFFANNILLYLTSGYWDLHSASYLESCSGRAVLSIFSNFFGLCLESRHKENSLDNYSSVSVKPFAEWVGLAQ